MRTTILTSVLFLGVGLACTQGCGSETEATNGEDAGSSGVLVGGGDGGTGSGGLGKCATGSRKADPVPLDMVIGLDTSFSMDFDDKWTNVRAAIKSFVKNPAYSELGIALQFFPIRKLCSVADYAKPAVGLQLQPQAASSIIAALDAQQMADGTPMVPLLQGLSQYLAANAKPDRKPVIVLATDGVPDSTCLGGAAAGSLSNTLDNAVAVATEAKNANPSIPTFVIGVGGELSALDAIAKAGGTEKAALVDTGGNTEQLFLKALDEIRKGAIACEFAVPARLDDPDKTNVSYTPAGGSTQAFTYVGNAAGCANAAATGWYFDNEKAPTKVLLCPAACDVVKKDDNGRVDVVFGCPRIEVR
jgi:hypothetical protein